MAGPSTYNSTVNAFYLAFYGRPADPAGMKFWAEQLVKSSGNIDTIKTAFATSEEARIRFGNDTAADRITEIYQQLFNRTPEAEGLAYWVNAISKGHASMADVAIAVMGGARGSDLNLTKLRQQAADSFTAEVQASGSAYNGVAAVEAARLLVRAVTPAATGADITALVKSTAVLADIATKTPDAVAALGSADELLGLLETKQGAADPVALVETLAETARGASADAKALASLMQGGGMPKLLASLPTGTALKDLVSTLGKGGLPALLKSLNPGGSAPGKPGTGDGGTVAVKLDFHLAEATDKVVLNAGTAVTGIGNATGLTLEDNSTGTAKPTATDYLGGSFAVEGNALSFGGALAADLYRMAWKADTFKTAGGYLAAGSALFAGGEDGMFVQEGFILAKSTTITGDLTRAGTELVSEAFIDDGSARVSIATGGGQDLVADNGGTLAIVYEHFDGAPDLVLGFDSGNDTVVFKGEAASAIDGNGDGKLQWASSKAVEASAEAVSVIVDAPIVMGNAAALPKTLEVLNAALDVSKVAANGELLILAKDSGDAAALFLYVNKDANGTIDAEELTQVAMFADGAPAQEDIVLVGTQAVPVA